MQKKETKGAPFVQLSAYFLVVVLIDLFQKHYTLPDALIQASAWTMIYCGVLGLLGQFSDTPKENPDKDSKDQNDG
jgi:hypothetical protein